jgi:flagellar motor switch protein FliG
LSAKKYTGPQQAAIILLALGEEIASEIFKYMSEYEIKRVGAAMGRLGRVPNENLEEIISKFYSLLMSNEKQYIGSSEYTRKLISGAFSEQEADNLINDLSLQHNASLDAVEMIEAKTLSAFLRNEHPQTIALILAHLDPKKFGEVLQNLPDYMHTDLLMRVAKLESVSPEILEEVDDVLRDEMQRVGSISSNKMGGVEAVAEMLNLIDKNTEEKALDKLEEKDPELAEQIRKLMFVFDDLVKIDDRGVQVLLREVKPNQLKMALKASSEPVKDLILRNMSKRASETLLEELENAPPAKLSDVEAAQYEIVQIARRLNDEGKIIISSGENSLV